MLNIKNQLGDVIGQVEYIEGDALDIISSSSEKGLKIKSHSKSEYTTIISGKLIKELYDDNGNKYYPGASYEDTIKDGMDLYVVVDNNYRTDSDLCLVRMFKVCPQRMKQYDIPKCVPLNTVYAEVRMAVCTVLCNRNGFLFKKINDLYYYLCNTGLNEVIGCVGYDSASIRTRDELYNFNSTDSCLVEYRPPERFLTNFNIYITEGRKITLDPYTYGKYVKRIKMIDKNGKKIEKEVMLSINTPSVHRHLYWVLDGFLGNLTLSVSPIKGDYWKSGEWDYEDYRMGKNIPLHEGLYTSLLVVESSVPIKCSDSTALFGSNVSFTTSQIDRLTFNP